MRNVEQGSRQTMPVRMGRDVGAGNAEVTGRAEGRERAPRLARDRTAAAERPPTPVTIEPGKPPASAELVEDCDSGKLYLRAYVQGHYIWQPVETEDAAAISDTGTWLVDGALHDAYWLNHGTYRRRAGKFHAVRQHASAA
jgi:hypothetical protein